MYHEPFLVRSRYGSLALNAPLIQCLRLSEDDQRRLESAGIITLYQLTRMTAYQVWAAVGGYYTDAQGKTQRGSLFLLLSDMLTTKRLQYVDCDPMRSLVLTPRLWREKYQAPDRISRTLVYNEIVGLEVLLALRTTDFQRLRSNPRPSDVMGYQRRLKEERY